VNHFCLYQFDQKGKPIELVEQLFVAFLVVFSVPFVLCLHPFLSYLSCPYLSFLPPKLLLGIQVDHRIHQVRRKLQVVHNQVGQGILTVQSQVLELQVLA